MGFIFGLIWIFILTLNLNKVVSDMMFLCSTIFIVGFYIPIEIRRFGKDVQMYTTVLEGCILGSKDLLAKHEQTLYGKKEETNNE